MHRIAVPILALALAATAVAAPRPDLLRIASKLSGLPAKRTVPVKILSGPALERGARELLDREYSRDRQAYDEVVYRALGLLPPEGSLRPALLRSHVRGVTGIYDPWRRTAYVRRGASSRDATLTALLQALADQTFDLRRLSVARRAGRDAGLAGAVAVDGAVAYARFGKSIRPGFRAAAPIDVFVAFERDARRTTGAGLAATLDYLGGRAAVWSALRRFPETTEQVLHIDAFLGRERPRPITIPESVGGFSLAGRDTWGELDVRALLAAFQVPRAKTAGTGWGGGASAVYRGDAGEAVALVLSWDSEADAAEWAEAVDVYVSKAFGRPANAVAFVAASTSTALVVGPTAETSRALATTLVSSTGAVEAVDSALSTSS